MLGILAPPVAFAAPVTTAYAATNQDPATVQGQQELSQTLETLFEEVMVIDESGIVSYDEEKAVELLGAEEAAALTVQLEAAALPRTAGATADSGQVRAAASNSFVDCMVENSVIGLVSGVVSGSFAELIREKKWDELAEKLWPKLVRAGVAGGVVGVAASLAASSVQCTIFND